MPNIEMGPGANPAFETIARMFKTTDPWTLIEVDPLTAWTVQITFKRSEVPYTVLGDGLNSLAAIHDDSADHFVLQNFLGEVSHQIFRDTWIINEPSFLDRLLAHAKRILRQNGLLWVTETVFPLDKEIVQTRIGQREFTLINQGDENLVLLFDPDARKGSYLFLFTPTPSLSHSEDAAAHDHNP